MADRKRKESVHVDAHQPAPNTKKYPEKTRSKGVLDGSRRAARKFGGGRDIADRKRVEEALMESKAHLAETQRLAAVGSWNWNIQGNQLTWSDELYRIYGLEPQGFKPTYEAFLERVHPEDRELIMEAVENCLKNHEPFSHDERIIRPDGEVRILHSSGNVICDAQGNPIRMFGASQDVTERTMAEKALNEAELRYRDIFENAVEGIFQTTPDGWFITANPALARMLGFETPDELIRDRTDIERQHFVRPERRAEFKWLLEERGVVQDFEFEAYKKDGSKIWMSDNVRAVRDERGRLLYYEGTVQDISERKTAEAALRESEERYRELFENAKDAIYVHDLSGRYVSVNRAAEKLSGFTREEIVGKHFSNFVNPRDLKYTRTNLCKKLDDEAETIYEVDMVTKDGRRVPVEISSRLIFENGVAIGVQGTARDITERRRGQEALRNYSRQLIEAQEAERQTIARELHDEIGQVLTAVRINLQSVQRSSNSSSPPIDESINIVDEALARVRELSFDLRPSLLDDLGLAAALRWYVDRYAQRTGIFAEVMSNFNSEHRLRRDLETACFRISQEALTNVARHAKAKLVVVQLKQSRSQDELLLIIKDDGVGLDQKLLQQPGLTSATLGLRGMEERAHAVGGVIEIKSAPSKGTEIRARFPIKFDR